MDLEPLMSRCVGLARDAAASGNYPLGALVAIDGEVVAESGSSLIGADDDPSAHPEMVVVRSAAKKAGSRYLPGGVLVTTLEPCPMCTSVAIWAKLGGIAYGASQADALAWSAAHPDDTYTWRQIAIRAYTVVAAGTPLLGLHEGVLRDACTDLFGLTQTN